MEMEFQFEELRLPLKRKPNLGLLAYGYAKLEGDEDGFSVTEIWLDGELIRPSGNGLYGLPMLFEDALFHVIAGVIENPKSDVGRQASDAWSEMVDEARNERVVFGKASMGGGRMLVTGTRT